MKVVQRAPIDAGRLRAALALRWPRIDVVAETTSTNAELLGRPLARDRTALVAELQTSGRGRFERIWASPPRAGLTFSVLLRPEVPVARWGWLPLLAGVALAEAVQDATGVLTALKWPNDLLAGNEGRKAAGILVQSADERVVIGMGLNVSTTRAELPVETATSLALQGASELDRTSLLTAILGSLDARVAQWSDHRGDAEACGLAAAYRGRCATIGTRVRVTAADDGVLEGAVTGIDPDGRLLLRAGDATHTIGAGDVEHLRSA